MSVDRDQVRCALADEARRPIDTSAATLAESIRQHHGNVVAAIILYGSCLRRPDPTAAANPLYDFYVLVDDYRRTYRNAALAIANKLLPPNVFYLEVPASGRLLRAKYAVVAQAHFRRLVSRRAFHSYFWARFAQPVRIAFARDADALEGVIDALVDSLLTFATCTGGLLSGEQTSAQFWVRGFLESYRAELRSERSDRARLIYESDRERYDGLAVPALRAAGLAVRKTGEGQFAIECTTWNRRLAEGAWTLRRGAGKLLSVVRLAKGVFTFDGGLEYVLWKIERHSGVKASPTAWERRHPLLAAPGLAWRLYRLGAFR